jgi:hypothetical protein
MLGYLSLSHPPREELAGLSLIPSVLTRSLPDIE